jgi:membrane-bound lytic murein transglycosylase D
MEEHLSMNRLLHALRTPGLAALLALMALVSGCATLPSPGSASADGQDTATGEATDTRPRQTYSLVPSGHLQPIQADSPALAPVAHLTAPNDLWERIRRGFAMPDLQGELVRDREQWYTSRPDYIFRMTERSRKYLFHIVEELERRDMPSELALLPFIESAFNPQAVSSAKAAGMWQFMPATGKDYDLKQNAFRDDRRDVLASTRAALDYLQMLHGMFNDWHLALAAYNWGQGNVKKAIERNQRKGAGTGYEDLNMPMETRMYVPKLQAVKNIVADPDRYASRLPLIENHPFFDTVTIDRDIDVGLAARLAEVDEDDFRALNPSINRPVILAAGTPHILLPWDNAAVFQRNLQYHVGPLASWTAWAVPSHMRTAEIAKRVGMAENELRHVNRIPPSMLVRAGSTLLVPRTDKHQGEVPEHMADNGTLQLQPEVTVRKTTAKARQGETVQAMARRLKLDAADLAQWNRLQTSSLLKAGQALTVHQAVRATAAAAAAPHRNKADTRATGKTVQPKPSRSAAKSQPARKPARK